MYKLIIVSIDCIVDEIICDDFYLNLKDRYVGIINKHNIRRKIYFDMMKELFVINYELAHVHEIKLYGGKDI